MRLFVKLFFKSNEIDRNNVEIIAEAASCSTMRYAPINGIEQQDIQVLHRARSQLVKERTVLGIQMRGLLAESGVVILQS